MVLHLLHFRTFAQATEDEEKVTKAMRFASGIERITKSKTGGYHGNPILILEVEIKSSKAIDAFFRRFKEEDVRELLDSLENRVNEECSFFLRLDKQAAFLGELRLLDSGDIISVSGKIKSYPKRFETAMANMRTYLQSLLEQ